MLLGLGVAAASAQVLVKPVDGSVLARFFDADLRTEALQCEATPIQPTLDFSFRFQTGYVVSFPFSQFHGPRHKLLVLLRVTADGAPPAYLLSRLDLPDTPQTELNGQMHGGFVVGQGKYKVDALIQDDRDRVCRGQWTIRAKLDGSQRGLHVAMPPLAVAGLFSPTPSAPVSGARQNLDRLTILLHVVPPSPQMAMLPAADALKLIGSLSALLDQLHPRSARLVAFNLRQQKVLFRKDAITAADLVSVAKLIDGVHFGTVEYAVLRNPKGAAELLKELTQEELADLQPSDALVFLGPHVDVQGSISSGAVKKTRNGPRIVYLECEPPLPAGPVNHSGPAGITAESATIPSQLPTESGPDAETDIHPDTDPETATNIGALSHVDAPDAVPPPPQLDDNALVQPDLIQKLVSRLKGKTIPIRTPVDCARAIQRLTPHNADQPPVNEARNSPSGSFDQADGPAH